MGVVLIKATLEVGNLVEGSAERRPLPPVDLFTFPYTEVRRLFESSKINDMYRPRVGERVSKRHNRKRSEREHLQVDDCRADCVLERESVGSRSARKTEQHTQR